MRPAGQPLKSLPASSIGFRYPLVFATSAFSRQTSRCWPSMRLTIRSCLPRQRPSRPTRSPICCGQSGEAWMETVTAALANYVAATRLADLPADVLHQAKRTYLNFIGCAVGGAHDDSVSSVARALRPFSGPPSASVLGRAERCDPLLASLLNGMSSAVYSFDDTH